MPYSQNLPFVTDENESKQTEAFLTGLTHQQQVQLESALIYHSLVNPGASIHAVISIGEVHQVPALTDSSTIDGRAAAGLPSHIELRVQSTALGENVRAKLTRFIRLGHRDASPATTSPPEQFSVPRKIYRELEKRGPVVLDSVREFIMSRRERAIEGALPRYPNDQNDASVQEAISRWRRIPTSAPSNAPPAILFGLHWLQTGGAERWAVESIQIAKDAGYLPVIITDQNSVHPWADRPELDGCVIISLSFDHFEHEIDIPLAHALLENFNLVGVMLHHSHYLYQMLPWFKAHRPNLKVVDSLHIVEYLGGGYPGISVHFDEFIDTHHVISPQLVEWLTDVQGVDRGKLALAPLTALTVDALGGFKPQDPAQPLTLAFVGRLSRQKRPDVFLGLVHRLRKQGVRFRAILHGDGEMRSVVGGLISQMKLDDVIEQRFEDVPVSETLAEADVLIVTSINEGLTLTTFESIAAGVPVISTHVGSQRTIVQGDALLPRPARPFIRGAAELIARFEGDEALRERIWAEQQERVKEFSALPTAHEWMKEYFESWQA